MVIMMYVLLWSVQNDGDNDVLLWSVQNDGDNDVLLYVLFFQLWFEAQQYMTWKAGTRKRIWSQLQSTLLTETLAYVRQQQN